MKRFGVAALFCGLFLSSTATSQTLRGTSDDYVVLAKVDKDLVASWLPDRLALDPEIEGEYPVMVSFGRQVNGGMLRYTELIVKVPHVRYADANPDAWFNFYHVLYMDSWTAVNGGIAIYDSPKKFAPITQTSNTLEAFTNTRPRNSLFEARFEAASDDLAPDNANLREVQSLLNGKGLTYMNGNYKCWSSTRTVTPLKSVKVDFKIHAGFFDGLDYTIEQSVDGVGNERFGGYFVSSDWFFFRVDCNE